MAFFIVSLLSTMYVVFYFFLFLLRTINNVIYWSIIDYSVINYTPITYIITWQVIGV